MHYEPWELVVSILTEGLVARGVDVTMFAAADSLTSARLAAVVPRGYTEDPALDAKVFECLHIAAAFERRPERSTSCTTTQLSRLVPTPLVTTVHGFPSDRIVPVFRAYNDATHLVAISASDRRPDLDYAATIHHGIPLDEFTFSPGGGDYLLFFGRIHPDKGAREAIEVARRTGRQLILAGIVHDAEYFRTAVELYIDGVQVRFVGAAGPTERDALLGGAAALLHLIQFDEPFGLSVIEAMATGTPVIAFRRGSMAELIDDRVTGFLVEPGDINAAVAAVEHVADLDRRAARTHVERHFSAERMVDDYLALYARLVRKRRQSGLASLDPPEPAAMRATRARRASSAVGMGW